MDDLTATDLQECIDDATRAGAARFPADPEPPKEVKTYDPSKVVVTFNGVELKGFMDGAPIEIERTEDEDGWTRHVPVNAHGTVNLTLIQESPLNQEVLGRFLKSGAIEGVEVRTWHFGDVYCTIDWARSAKMSRRRVLRAQARARKRRRGWA